MKFCVASIQEWLLIESGVYDLVLKRTFQVLYQPPLCYNAVPTRHRQDTTTLATATDSGLEESDSFADFEEDEDELENKLVLEDC